MEPAVTTTVTVLPSMLSLLCCADVGWRTALAIRQEPAHIPRKDGGDAKQGGACGKDLLGLCPIWIARGWESLSNVSVPPQLDPPCPYPRSVPFFLSLPFPFVPSLPRTGPSPCPSLCSPKCPLLTLSASSSVTFCLRGLQLSCPVCPG